MFKVLFARFPYGATEHYHVTNWMIETIVKCKQDSRISEVLHREYNDTPITMTRNLALIEAKERGVDYTVFIDSDMSPDLRLPGARPFWDSSWEFLMNDREKGPACIAAPYCGPPPSENVYVFRWCNYNTGDPGSQSYRLDQFSREEAATRTGIEEVAALPTGLMIIDMRALDKLPHPYFDYEWDDHTCSRKASTEDVFFTRNLTLLGVPQFCNWDSWAGHVKDKVVTKPWLMTVDDVRKEFADSIRNNLRFGEAHINVGKTRFHQSIVNPDRSKWQAMTASKNGSEITMTKGPISVRATDHPTEEELRELANQPIQIIDKHVELTFGIPTPTTLDDFADQWSDKENWHRCVEQLFQDALQQYPELAQFRRWMEDNQWGFTPRASVCLWKLVVDTLPRSFSFLEVGVHRGQTVALIGLLAKMSGKQATVVALSTFDGREVSEFDPKKTQTYPDMKQAWSRFAAGRNNLLPISGDSTSEAAIVEASENSPYDVVFIDGGHDYATAKSDIDNYAPMVKPGGILVVDDCATDLKMPRGTFAGFVPVTDAAAESLPMGHVARENQDWVHLGSVVHMRIWKRKIPVAVDGANLAPQEESLEKVAG